jgi:predicted RNase H-like HicB family nuclease
MKMQTEFADATDERHGADVTELLELNDPRLKTFSGGAFECRAILCPERDGGYSIHALRLPGVVSYGDTEADAMKNITEAFQGALESYLESGDPIPWADIDIDRPQGSKERWILVNV